MEIARLILIGVLFVGVVVAICVIESKMDKRKQLREQREEREYLAKEPVKNMLVELDKSIDRQTSYFMGTINAMENGTTTLDIANETLGWKLFSTRIMEYYFYSDDAPIYDFIKNDKIELTVADINIVGRIAKKHTVDRIKSKNPNISVNITECGMNKYNHYVFSAKLSYNNPQKYKRGL